MCIRDRYEPLAYHQEFLKLIEGIEKQNPYYSLAERLRVAMDCFPPVSYTHLRVIIIKLADRLHNMRTLDFKSDARRREISLETMEIYAPIAHRLGIRAVKEELEDRALRYLDPIGYKEIEDTLALKKGDREKFIDEIKEKILTRLKEYGIEPHIEGRVKSIYGLSLIHIYRHLDLLVLLDQDIRALQGVDILLALAEVYFAGHIGQNEVIRVLVPVVLVVI